MKTILITSLLCLASSAALAQPISLKAGSSVVIAGNLVSCEGPSEDSLPDACAIKQNGTQYILYVGETVAETFYSFNAAVAGAKQMKEAGLCR